MRCAYGELPSWLPASDLLKKGRAGMGIMIVYLLPATIALAQYPNLEDVPAAIIATVLFVLALLLIPAALMLYLTESAKSAFNLVAISSSVFSLHYLGTWFFAAIPTVITTWLMSMLQDWALTTTTNLAAFTILGGLCTMLVTIWSFTLYGQVWDEL